MVGFKDKRVTVNYMMHFTLFTSYVTKRCAVPLSYQFHKQLRVLTRMLYIVRKGEFLTQNIFYFLFLSSSLTAAFVAAY